MLVPQKPIKPEGELAESAESVMQPGATTSIWSVRLLKQTNWSVTGSESVHSCRQSPKNDAVQKVKEVRFGR
jgi:hypothetical protein